MYDSKLSDLRTKHLSLSVYVLSGKAINKIGGGYRVVYLVSCNGRELVCITTTGEKYSISLSDIKLKGVNDIRGKPVPFYFDENNGHLMVRNGNFIMDHGPWKKYERNKQEEVIVPTIDDFDTVV